MPEDVLFEEERAESRSAIADYLRTVADNLDAGDPITFSGTNSVTVDPPERPTFEVKVERERPAGAERGELSVEFEIEWDENGDGDADVSGFDIE